MSLRVAFCVITALNKDYHLPLETCRQLIFGEDVSFSPHFPWLILYASVLMNLEGHWFFNVEELYRLDSSVLLAFLTSAGRLKDAPVWAANKQKPCCPDCATCRWEAAASATKMTIFLSLSHSNTLSLPSLFFPSSMRTRLARWAPLSSAQPCKLSVRTCAWICTDYLLPFWPLSFKCPPSRQECSATGGWWSCCTSALRLEPCTCPSTALCHVSPGCARSLVTSRHLSALKHKLVSSAQSQFVEF